MLEQMGAAAASYNWRSFPAARKPRAGKIADYLESQSQEILLANEQDLLEARRNGLSEAMLDRLALTPARLKGIADDVRQVCNLADPVGQVIDGGLLDSGLRLERRRVPLGVIGVIYEARPNVTVDVASLCLKTGNAAILRGGKETAHQRRDRESHPAGAAGVRLTGRCRAGYRKPGPCAGERDAAHGQIHRHADPTRWRGPAQAVPRAVDDPGDHRRYRRAISWWTRAPKLHRC